MTHVVRVRVIFIFNNVLRLDEVLAEICITPILAVIKRENVNNEKNDREKENYASIVVFDILIHTLTYTKAITHPPNEVQHDDPGIS